MAILRTMQPAFTAGELAPGLWARVDLNKYQSGLKVAKNVFVHAHGGVSNRAGFEFMGRVRNAGVAILVPFVYDVETDQTYNLEFTDQRMRVYRAGNPVLEGAKTITGLTSAAPGIFTSAGHGFSAGDELFVDDLVGPTILNGRSLIVRSATTDTFTLEDLFEQPINTGALPGYISGGTARRIYEIATPYGSSELPELVYAQENDVMYITHRLHPPQKLSRLDDDDWQLATPTFAPSIVAPTGIAGTAIFKLQSGNSGNLSFRITAIGPAGLESAASTAATVLVQYEKEDGRRMRLTWNASPGAVRYRVYRSDADVGILAETPNTEIELGQTQFVGDGTAVPVVSAPGSPSVPVATSASIVFGEELSYKVAAVSDANGEESLPSAVFTP